MKLDLKKLFVEETNDAKIQFFRYIFVGGFAFVADWLALFIFTELGLHLFISVALAFIIGLVVNYILSKMFVFKKDVKSKVGEFLVFAIIGVIGLGLTELLMWVSTEKLHIYYLISKVIVAAIVLVWNFLARKIILYRK